MSKYIIENTYKKKELKEFMNDDNKVYVEYLISVIGNVEMSEEYFRMYISQFSRIAGPYNVLTEPSTIKSMYDFGTMYPRLNHEAINVLFPKYIDDLFEKNGLIKKFENFIKLFGYTDEAYEIYLDYIDRKGKELQEQYVQEIAIFDELKGIYSDNFIKYLENLVLKKHYSSDDIMKHIPSEEFIKKDENTLKELINKYRIFFGFGYPISYELVELSLKGESRDDETDLKYVVNIGDTTNVQSAGFNFKDFNVSKNKRLQLK